MSNEQVSKRLRLKLENRNLHLSKLKTVKEHLLRCSTPTAEEIEKGNQYHQRMLELMNDDLDPFSCVFESGSNDSAEQPSLILSILKGCKLYNEVTNKLNSVSGHFNDGEAFLLMDKLLEYLLIEYEATTSPIPSEHTYNSRDYYLDGNKLVFEPKEEFDVASEKRWALGVIYYYLVTGYPALNGKHQIEFYNEVGLGPKLNTPARNLLIQKRHIFPSKNWERLSEDVRKCIKGLTCYHPGNRTSTDDLCFDWLPCHDIEDYNKQMNTNRNDSKKSMNDTMLKAIVDVKTMKMNKLREEKSNSDDKKKSNSDDQLRNRQKEEWASFFIEARKQSRKKRRFINSSNNKNEREEKDNTERKIKHWLNLYYSRRDSDDAYKEYNTAIAPEGAWGRVE